jgi:AcrR family transcriptional regulator
MKRNEPSPPVAKKRNLRDMQKATTLAIIKDAARGIFSSGHYDSVSVDDIANEAGVSRGTVYMHFRTKLDILLALINDDLDTHLACYEALANLHSFEIKFIVRWLNDFIDATKASNQFLAVFFRYNNTDNFSMVMDNRDRVIEILGKRYSGFIVKDDAGEVVERRRAQCYMMLSLIETGSITYSIDTTFGRQKVGIEMLAEVLAHFLATGEIHSAV